MKDLIRIRQSNKYPELSVRKYNRKVFYNNLWHEDEMLLESRGHVINSKGDIVVNAFTKVFNYKENGTTIPDNNLCLCIDKINGFMACLTWVPDVNDVVVSTTGSLDSDYVEMAREMLPYAIEVIRERKEKLTYIFEIVHPNDPHIIKENIGAYLLGVRYVDEHTPYQTNINDQYVLDDYARLLRVSRPYYFVEYFDKIKELVKECKHEGYMVYDRYTKVALKIKSPYYLALKAIARKKDILSLNKERVDEEYYGLLEHLKGLDNFNELSEQDRLNYIKEWLANEY